MKIKKIIIYTLLILLAFSILSKNTSAMDGRSAIEAELNKTYNYWPDDKDTYSYSSSGNFYSLFKPEISYGNGWHISFVISHNRSFAKDDYAHVTLIFNEEGALIDARTEVRIANKPLIKAEWAATSSFLLDGTGMTSLAISAAAEIGNQVLSAIELWDETGGRLHFPSVIQHNINYISEDVITGLNNYKSLSESGCYVEFFGEEDYENPSIGLLGPASFEKIEYLYKYAALYRGEIIDWQGEVKGITVGPGAWIVIFEDENFSKDSKKAGFSPGFTSAELYEYEDIPDISSFIIYENFPPEYKGIDWY